MQSPVLKNNLRIPFWDTIFIKKKKPQQVNDRDLDLGIWQIFSQNRKITDSGSRTSL